MAKTKDLSPKLSGIVKASTELYVPPLDVPIGQLIGGLATYQNSLKRGRGDDVFGVDENGLWLGAADFVDALFRVNYKGEANLKKATFENEDGVTIIDGTGIVSSASFLRGSIVLEDSANRSDPDWADVDGLELSFTLPRACTVLILATLTGKNSSVDVGGTQYVRFKLNDIETDAWDLSGIPDGFTGKIISSTIHYITSLPSGDNVIKIQHKWTLLGNAIIIGADGAIDAGSRFSYLILGT